MHSETADALREIVPKGVYVYQNLPACVFNTQTEQKTKIQPSKSQEYNNKIDTSLKNRLRG
jgi:hypothetical protein